MATSKNKRTPTKVEWKGYLSVNLSPDDEALFDAWETERVFGISDVSLLVDSGYKFSLNWDSHHSGFVAGLYSSSEKLAWPGWTLTAWADDAETAVRLLMYKHYVMCVQDWEKFTGKVERSGRKYG